MDPSILRVLGIVAAVLVAICILLPRVIRACRNVLVQGYIDHLNFEFRGVSQLHHFHYGYGFEFVVDHFDFEFADGRQVDFEFGDASRDPQQQQQALQVLRERQQVQERVLLAFREMKANELLARGARIAKFHVVGAHQNMNPMPDTNPKVVGILTYVVGSSTTDVAMDANSVPLYEGYEECSICLCPYEEDEELSQIQACKHHFHQQCLHKWAVSSLISTPRWFTCPLCKARIS